MWNSKSAGHTPSANSTADSDISPLAPHIAENMVVEFLLDRLPADRAAEVQEHLDHCSECAADMLALYEAAQRWEDPDYLAQYTARLVSLAEERAEQVMDIYRAGDDFQKTIFGGTTMNAEISRQQTTVKSWANIQKDADAIRKRLVATWAARNFRLRGGSGVYFDAGSSCLSAWEELAKQIVTDGHPSQIQVVTNNLMILNHFANDPSPLLHGTRMSSVGEYFDVLHQAYFGPAIETRLRSGVFCPDVMYIGTNGIGFGEDGALLFGFHADEPELEVKQLLFANPCKAKARVILTTPPKIGNPGGTVFDILKLKELDCRSPLYLLTTAPTDEEREAYEDALRIFRTDTMQNAIRDRKLNFRWIEVQGPGPDDYNDITSMVASDAEMSRG